MSKVSWLLVTLLAVVCLYLGWDNVRLRRRRPPPAPPPAEVVDSQACASMERVLTTLQQQFPASAPRPARAPDEGAARISAQAAMAFLVPQPGESLVEYRDRLLPLARAVVNPQRERVARLKSRFVESARLDAAQERVLDEAVAAAGEALKDRIAQGVLSGELGLRMKPAQGVAFARDLLDATDGANRTFRAALRPEQVAALDEDRFDVAEYVLFRTRWEDLLGVTE